MNDRNLIDIILVTIIIFLGIKLYQCYQNTNFQPNNNALVTSQILGFTPLTDTINQNIQGGYPIGG